MNKPLTLCVLCVLCGSVTFAQNYRCDWSVVGLGGGDMSSASYRAGTTVGQTAVGRIAGTAYQAFIGFWQVDTTQAGIVEDQHWSIEEPLKTALNTPYPNPSPLSRLPVVQYSLASEDNVSIDLYDLSGRIVTTLVRTRQKPGRYSVPISAHSSLLTAHSVSGVYFLKMTAGEYRATRKLVLQ